MGVNFAVIVVMLALGRRFVIIIGVRFVTEQRAFQRLTGCHAAGSGRQAEQGQGLFQLGPGSGDPGFVGIGGGLVFETHQVHCRALQFQLQCLTVQRRVQAADAMLMGLQAAMLFVMFMVVIMFMGLSGVSIGQRQQGEWQSEQQTTHGDSPGGR